VQQGRPGEDAAGSGGQRAQHRHGRGCERAQLAVDYRGVAAQGQGVPGHLQREGTLGQLVDDRADQGAQAGPGRGDYRHVVAAQRGGRHRAHAGDQDVTAERVQQCVAVRTGGAEQRVDRRGGGEGDRVHQVALDQVDQALQGRRVGGRRPAIDRDLGHPGAGGLQCLGVLGLALAVQLERHGEAGDAPGPEVVDDLLVALALGAPVVVQAGRADRGAGLGAAADQVGAGQNGPQRLGQAPALGGLQPAAHADAGVDQHDVGWGVEAGPGGGLELGVVGDRDDAQRGGEHDPGAPAFQEAGQLVTAPVGRDTDRVAGQ
jgi:hypothetical protein